MRYRVDDYMLDGNKFIGPSHSLHFELDSKRIFIVQAADDVEGWIEAPLISIVNHKPYFDRNKDEYVIERKYGKVRILIDDPFYSRIDEETGNIPLWSLIDESYPFHTKKFNP